MLTSIIKTYTAEILTAFLMVLILNVGLAIARINFNIQMKSFHQDLKQQEMLDENASYTRLLVKYINQKGIYEGTLNQNQMERAEFDYNQNANSQKDGLEDPSKVSAMEIPVIILINAIRKITGNPPISLTDNQNNDSLSLYKAYNYENSRNYTSALVIYDTFLKNDINNNFKANVILHSGYCYALLEDYDKARADYKQIINDYKNSSIAVAAALLLRYMEMFLSERQTIMESAADDLTKGEKLAALLNHKDALKVLEKARPKTKEEESRLEYAKGVSYEELGDKKNAVNSYIKSIQADNNSQAAKYANRRVYTIASGTSDKKIMDSSVKIGVQQNDNVLQEISQIYHDRNAETNNKAQQTNSIEADPDENNLNTGNILAALESIQSNTIKENEIQIKNKKAAASKIRIPVINKIPVITAEKYLSRLIGKKIIVTTISNETFSGILKTSEEADFIIIKTLIGSVGIEKKNIKMITNSH